MFTLQECLVKCNRFFVEFGHPGLRPAENSVEVRLGVGHCFAHFAYEFSIQGERPTIWLSDCQRRSAHRQADILRLAKRPVNEDSLFSSPRECSI